MIVVIADDLTGAAELGGLALRFNLVTEINTRVNFTSTADLLIIATDTRSLSEKAAEQVMEGVCRDLQQLKPALVYKKTDSVLRGHILAEIKVQKEILNLKRALIVSANPSLGRTVVDGHYLLNDRPVHLSSFSKDPEFPIGSSALHKMLRTDAGVISVLKKDSPMPEKGIIVGEVKDASDLAAWCGRIDGDTLVAGAAEFFTALLTSLGFQNAPKAKQKATMQMPVLMICGSPFQKSYEFVKQMRREGVPVRYIPPDITNVSVFQAWMDETVVKLQYSGKVIVAVDPAIEGINALELRTTMAEAVALLLSRVGVKECLVEGGSTSAAIMRKLGIDTLYPMQEMAPGIVRMAVNGRKELHVTVKPGSYEWPPFILPHEIAEGSYEIDCV